MQQLVAFHELFKPDSDTFNCLFFFVFFFLKSSSRAFLLHIHVKKKLKVPT